MDWVNLITSHDKINAQKRQLSRYATSLRNIALRWSSPKHHPDIYGSTSRFVCLTLLSLNITQIYTAVPSRFVCLTLLSCFEAWYGTHHRWQVQRGMLPWRSLGDEVVSVYVWVTAKKHVHHSRCVNLRRDCFPKQLSLWFVVWKFAKLNHHVCAERILETFPHSVKMKSKQSRDKLRETGKMDVYPLKTNMEPENHPLFVKDNYLPNLHFGFYASFWGCIDKMFCSFSFLWNPVAFNF